jgi:hypothetical protein
VATQQATKTHRHQTFLERETGRRERRLLPDHLNVDTTVILTRHECNRRKRPHLPLSGSRSCHQADGVEQAVHNVSMRAQRDRDEQSVLIGTALGVFALVSTAEALGLWLAHFVFDFEGRNAMVGWVVVIAGALAIVNLVRSERT